MSKPETRDPKPETILFELADPKRPATKVTHGDAYSREFKGKPPFEATDQEWNLFLKNTGVFKEVSRDEGRGETRDEGRGLGGRSEHSTPDTRHFPPTPDTRHPTRD